MQHEKSIEIGKIDVWKKKYYFIKLNFFCVLKVFNEFIWIYKKILTYIFLDFYNKLRFNVRFNVFILI